MNRSRSNKNQDIPAGIYVKWFEIRSFSDNLVAV
jgi:hypothetical protein